MYALTADTNGTLYAGGGFSNLENIPAADNVAYLPAGGSWQAMGAGAGPCGCAVTTFVRGLTTVGTDAYIGTDANDVAGIAQADHVARWNGSAWSALGADSGGANGWFPATSSISALAGTGPYLFVAGSFQNAGGDARADNVAFFDGSAWHPVGSDGAGNGPWIGNGLALALVDRQLVAAGSFTSAGGDAQRTPPPRSRSSQIIAYPTPTVTPNPPAVPTPTVTPGPSRRPPPSNAPSRRARHSARHVCGACTHKHPRRTATLRFAIQPEPRPHVLVLPRHGDAVLAVLRTRGPTTSSARQARTPRHESRDRAGNVDATPAVTRYRIRRR